MATSRLYGDALRAKYRAEIATRLGSSGAGRDLSWTAMDRQGSADNTRGTDGTPDGGRHWADPEAPIGRILDVLAQPLYSGVQSTLETGEDIIQGRARPETFSNVLAPFVSNLGTANAKIAPSDILRGDAPERLDRAGLADDFSPETLAAQNKITPLANKPGDRPLTTGAKFTLGLAADIGLDPLTYVPGGIIAGGARRAGQAAKGAVDTAAETATAAGKTDTFAQRLSNDLEVTANRFNAAKTAVNTKVTQPVNRAVAKAIQPIKAVVPKSIKFETAELGRNLEELIDFGDIAPTPNAAEAAVRHDARQAAETAPEGVPGLTETGPEQPQQASSPPSANLVPEAPQGAPVVPEAAAPATRQREVQYYLNPVTGEKISSKRKLDELLRQDFETAKATAGPRYAGQNISDLFVEQTPQAQADAVKAGLKEGSIKAAVESNRPVSAELPSVEEWLNGRIERQATAGYDAPGIRVHTGQNLDRNNDDPATALEYWNSDNQEARRTIYEHYLEDHAATIGVLMNSRAAMAAVRPFDQFVKASAAAIKTNPDLQKKFAWMLKQYRLNPGRQRATLAQLLKNIGVAGQESATQIAKEAFDLAYQQYSLRAMRAAIDTPAVAPMKPAEEATEAARVAAQETIKEQAAKQGKKRLSGKQLDDWIARHSAFLEADDLSTLLNVRNSTAFEKSKTRILGQSNAPRKRTKVEEALASGMWRHITETIEEPLAAPGVQSAKSRIAEVTSSAERMEMWAAKRTEIAAGSNLDAATRDALSDVYGKQQLWRDPTGGGEFPLETPKQGTRRTDETPRVGKGVNREANNRNAQMNLFQKLVDDSVRELPDDLKQMVYAKKGGLDRKAADAHNNARSQAMYDSVMPRLRAAEEFLMANGVYGHGATGKGGPPILLSQILDSVTAAVGNRTEFVRNNLFSIWNPRPRFTGSFKPGRGPAPKPIPNAMLDSDAFLRAANDILVTARKVFTTPDLQKTDSIYEDIYNQWNKTGNVSAAGDDMTPIMQAILGYDPATKTMRGVTHRRSETGRVRYDELPKAEGQLLPEGMYGEVAEKFSNPIFVRSLLQFAEDNAARAGLGFAQDVAALRNEAITQILKTLDDPTLTLADKAHGLIDPKTVVREIQKTHGYLKKPLTEETANAVEEGATQLVKQEVTEVVPAGDIRKAEAMAKVAKEFSDEPITGKTLNETQNVANRIHEGDVEDVIREADVANLVDDPAQINDLAMQTGLFRMLDPLFRTFAAHYGNATFHSAMLRAGNVGGVMARAYRRDLVAADEMAKHLARQQGREVREVWKEAFTNVQRGAVDNANKFESLVRAAIDPMFSPESVNGASSLLSMWQREGFDIDHIEDMLRSTRYGFADGVTMKPPVAKGKKALTAAEQSDLWRTWKIDDPVDFLSKMHTLSTQLATEAAISHEFARIGKLNGMVSTRPRDGFVKLTRSVKYSHGPTSLLARYLPKDAEGFSYMHPDAFREMKRMDDLIRGSMSDTQFTSFLKKNMDPLLSMWKAGMTIWRPGHHVRTLMGDMGMSFLISGVKDPRYYHRALRVVVGKRASERGLLGNVGSEGANFRGEYGVWDAMKALQGLSDDLDAKKFATHNVGLAEDMARYGGASSHYTGNIARVKIGKQSHDLNVQDVWRGLMDRGVLPDFRRQEDIIEATEDSWARKVQKKSEVFGGRVRDRVGNFVEGRDDFVRVAHALHLLENGLENTGWKAGTSVNTVMDEVAARLRKAHPDGTDLTPFEQKYVRRMLPFYSWTRKAIPLVIEQMLMHPGRWTAYSKAMYNFGQANGVDLESVSNPFPDDQLFPEFLTDQMTGVGFEANDKYYSFNLGQPQADLFRDFFAGTTKTNEGLNPAWDFGLGLYQGVAGMGNPLITVPNELSSGVTVEGIPAGGNPLEAIESSIPIVNNVASVTGYSPLNTIANARLTPLESVQRGTRGGVTENPEYLANWLLGLQITDTSKPNYINLAEIEQRNRLGNK